MSLKRAREFLYLRPPNGTLPALCLKINRLEAQSILVDQSVHSSVPGSTNVPTSIYRFTTHGCIRLHPDDAAALFALVEVGTSVEIIYEPVLVTRLVSGEVLVEVHRDPYKRGSTTVAAVERLLAEAGAGELVGSDDVKRIVKARTGRASLVPSQMSGRANETP